jgi:hypothetical protein
MGKLFPKYELFEIYIPKWKIEDRYRSYFYAKNRRTVKEEIIMSNYIYKLLNKQGVVLYVGKTKDIKNRFVRHYSEYGHLDKLCYLNTNRIQYAELPSETLMDLYEIIYINIYQPRYNITSKYKDVIDTEYITLKALDWIDFDINKFKSLKSKFIKREIQKKKEILKERKEKHKFICLNTEDVFDSFSDVSKKYKLPYSTTNKIPLCCNGVKKSMGKDTVTGEKLRWMWYVDYQNIEKDSNRVLYLKDEPKYICLNTKMTFYTMQEAVNYCGNTYTSKISDCCNGKRKHAGYDPITGDMLAWMYYEEYIKLSA